MADALKALTTELAVNEMLPREMQVPEHIDDLRRRIAILERRRGLKIVKAEA